MDNHKALEDAVLAIKYADTPVKVGSFQGFDLSVTVNSNMIGGGMSAGLQGATSHTTKLIESFAHNLNRLEAALYNIDGRIERTQDNLAKLRLDHAEAQKIVAVLLRVQHILQRAYRAELSRTKPAPLQLGERCVDLNDAIVTLPEGKTLALTATELALLRKLAENRGHIVTYDALCAAVWGADYYGYENSLGVHIRHLREKLEAEPGAPQFLRTVRGIGYKLTKGEEA